MKPASVRGARRPLSGQHAKVMAVVLAGASLGACTVELVGRDGASAASSRSGPATPGAVATSTPGSTSATGSAGAALPATPRSGLSTPTPATGSPGLGLPADPSSPDPTSRAGYAARADRVLRCGPGGLEVVTSGGITRVEGACTTLTVMGSGAVVVADEVERLVVTSTAATVLVDSVEEVSIAGTSNTVLWERGAPTVHDSGTASTVKQGGS